MRDGRGRGREFTRPIDTPCGLCLEILPSTRCRRIEFNRIRTPHSIVRRSAVTLDVLVQITVEVLQDKATAPFFRPLERIELQVSLIWGMLLWFPQKLNLILFNETPNQKFLLLIYLHPTVFISAMREHVPLVHVLLLVRFRL